MNNEKEGITNLHNMSFDEGDFRMMKNDFDAYAKRMVKMKKPKKDITIPKAPKVFKENKKMSIRQRKVQKMIDEVEFKEEYEINNKFRANPLPPGIHIPLY